MNKALPKIKEDISQLEHLLRTERDTRLKEGVIELSKYGLLKSLI